MHRTIWFEHKTPSCSSSGLCSCLSTSPRCPLTSLARMFLPSTGAAVNGMGSLFHFGAGSRTGQGPPNAPLCIEMKVITHYALLGSVILLFHRNPFVSSWLSSDVTRNAQTSLSFCEHDSDTEAPRICNCADDLTLGSAEMASQNQTREEEGKPFFCAADLYHARQSYHGKIICAR